MLRGTLARSLVRSAVASANASLAASPSSSSSFSSPSTVLATQLPRLPESPIFDPPSNAFVDMLLDDSQWRLVIPNASALTDEEAARMRVTMLNAIVAAVHKATEKTSLALTIVFALELLVYSILLARVCHNRHKALRGDVAAAQKIVLPAFEPLLWLLCASASLIAAWYALCVTTVSVRLHLSKAAYEVTRVGKDFLFVVVLAFLQQSNLTMRALWRAVLLTLALTSPAVPAVWVMQTYGHKAHALVYFWVRQSLRLLQLVYVVYVVVRPPTRASVVTIRAYCAFVAAGVLGNFAAVESYHEGAYSSASIFAWLMIAHALLAPLFVYPLLRADTEHWRGMGARAVELQQAFRLRQGRVDERVSSQGFHLLLEMHSRFIIDFADLELYERIDIDTGGDGTSRGRLPRTQARGHEDMGGDGNKKVVVRGLLRAPSHCPVAVKIYSPSVFTEETVAEFSHEAALCGSLQHPNIVTFHGLCVFPPSICLITELCQGSLRDITCALAATSCTQATRRHSHGVHTPRQWETTSHLHRQQVLINLGYMLDAARAVAHLHSFSPPFVHRGIKPTSFLVDTQGNVKLTNFGESRTLAVRPQGHAQGGVAATPDQPPTLSLPISSRFQSRRHAVTREVLSKIMEVPGLPDSDTATGAPEYMAPEVIRSRNAGASLFGEMADVFALAMTMWDILYPGKTKYPPVAALREAAFVASSGSHDGSESTSISSTSAPVLLEAHVHVGSGHGGDGGGGVRGRSGSTIFDHVFTGDRPLLCDGDAPTAVLELIESMWDADPRRRPDMPTVVRTLECIQEETAALFAQELMEAVGHRERQHQHQRRPSVRAARKPEQAPRHDRGPCDSFTGASLMDMLSSRGCIANASEGVRFGNLLLDAGFLHHTTHAKSFENSTARYFFDTSRIELWLPLHAIGSAVDDENDDNVILVNDSSSSLGSVSSSSSRQNTYDEKQHQKRSPLQRPGSTMGWPFVQLRSTRSNSSSKGQQRFTTTNGRGSSVECVCRQLGQRLEEEHMIRFRRQIRMRSEENLLTARLLVEDGPSEMTAFHTGCNWRESIGSQNSARDSLM